MTIKDLGTNMDRQWRIDLNNNFRELSGMQGSVNDAVDKSNSAEKKAEEAKEIAGNANNTSKSVQDQLNQIVVSGDSSVESAQARVDGAGHAYDTLKDRIDAEQNKIGNLEHLGTGPITLSKSVSELGVNPKNFGAKGDYVTDDIQKIREAIDSVKTTGGKIVLPPGIFFINDDLIIPAKIDLEGSGSGETPSLAKTTILLGDNASIIVKGRNVSLSKFLTTPKNPLSHTKDGIVIGTDVDNAGRCKIKDVSVLSAGEMGIKLVQSNGFEIDAQVVNNKSNGFGIRMSSEGNGSGGLLRIDAYGNGGDGIDLANSSGISASIISQSNRGNGIRCVGWGNSITGYVEFNGLDESDNVIQNKYNALLEGNASGNSVVLAIWDKGKGNKISYPKGQLRYNNFIKTIDGNESRKDGFFATTRLRLDSIIDVLSSVNTPTSGDIISTSSGVEALGKGLYKYDPSYGWLRLDGVTFRSRPGTPTKGMMIVDVDNVLKYSDGTKWFTTSSNFNVEGISQLPTADASQRGRLIRLEQGPGLDDLVYMCIKTLNNAYEWKRINLT